MKDIGKQAAQSAEIASKVAQLYTKRLPPHAVRPPDHRGDHVRRRRG
jgi:hypothetical protein